MYIASSMFAPPTPSATSHASTATALPPKPSGSNNDVERGRSPSRPSSASSSSSAVLLLSPNSVDSATLPGYPQGPFTYPAPRTTGIRPAGQPSSTTSAPVQHDLAGAMKSLLSRHKPIDPIPPPVPFAPRFAPSSQNNVDNLTQILQGWHGYSAGRSMPYPSAPAPAPSSAHNRSQMPSMRASDPPAPSYPPAGPPMGYPYTYPYALQPPMPMPAKPAAASSRTHWATWQLDPVPMTVSLPDCGSPGLFGPRTPREDHFELRVPDAGSPGLFGPRSPSPKDSRYFSEGSAGLFGHRSPGGSLYNLTSTVPQPTPFGAPVQYYETDSTTVPNTPRPLSTVSEVTEPISLSPAKIRTAAAPSSPADARRRPAPSVPTPVVITIPSRTASRASSISAQSYSSQPAIPIPAQASANRTRGRSPGVRSRSVSPSSYASGAVSYHPSTVVIRARSRSSSRSRSRTPHAVIERQRSFRVQARSRSSSRSPSPSPQILRQLPPPTARTGSHRSSRTRSMSPSPYPPAMAPRVGYQRSRSPSPATIDSRSRTPIVVQPTRGRSRSRSPRPIITIVPASNRDDGRYRERSGSPLRSFGAPGVRVSYAVPQMNNQAKDRSRRNNRAANQRRVHHAHRPLSPSTVSSTSSADMPPRVVTGMIPPPASATMFIPPVSTPPIPGSFPYVQPTATSAAPYVPQAGLGYMPYAASMESPLWTPPSSGRPVGTDTQETWGWPGVDSSAWGPVRHPRFWFEDGNLAVRVENTRYNLHRHIFAKRGTLLTLLNYDQFSLCEIKEKKVDFDRLLSILYPVDYGSYECKTTEEWTSVLLLADKWNMWDIRRLAISQLSLCAGAVDKIALGHRYNVPHWLGPAYMELTMRGEAITAEEGAKLGVDAMVRLGALKDEVFANLPAYVDEDKFSDLFEQKMWV